MGLPVELPAFSPKQVATLAQRHGLRWGRTDIDNLIELVGGNPYLVRLTLYQAQKSGRSLNEIRQSAIAPNSIYTDHLQKKVWALEPHPQLLVACQQVMLATEPVNIDPVLMLRLEGMGLIKIQQHSAVPTCDLYQRYFARLFSL